MSVASAAAPYKFDLPGRVALVTGASSGIGKHLARWLAASGAKVVVAARRIDRLHGICQQIATCCGQANPVEMDVTDEESIVAAFDAAEKVFAPVNTVMANAGMNFAGSALGLAMEGFDETMAVNVRGVFLTVREGARRMVASGSVERHNDRIVIMSSMTATQITPGAAASPRGRKLACDGGVLAQSSGPEIGPTSILPA